ncbi:hypothetical protein F4819DRAFT_89204 [Hypoxylon fuscum]|nr:hypothetical protein F4819DRAFT_89204 [Hypoxylon fuscum]
MSLPVNISGTITRTLCFYSSPPGGATPEYIAETGTTPGERNYPHERVLVSIRDIRGHEEDFTLDQHSFAALPALIPPHVNFEADDEIEARYLPWVKSLIMDSIPFAESTTIFDFTVRKASALKTANRQVHKIHIDQSPKGAYLRINRHLSVSELKAIEAGKATFRIVNVWKPINQTVTDHPLAFGEYKSLRTTDLVPVRQVYPDYVGETYALKYNENQKFRYWSNATPNDILLLQCFNSRQLDNISENGLRYNQCAHGSFELSELGDQKYARESIEVRCIVVVKERID